MSEENFSVGRMKVCVCKGLELWLFFRIKGTDQRKACEGRFRQPWYVERCRSQLRDPSLG